ncbi:MAG: hypothetical protein IJE19_05530 [Clostridia bacterium]|nr:hypothetical protein [Clostridia bacterium]
MKKFLAIILTFVLCFGVLSVALAAEDEPVTAVPDGYIGIYTAKDLDNIRNNLSGKYILMNNIDLSSYENWAPIGSYEAPFTGEFDGNSYSVSNLSISEINGSNPSAGLFGTVTDSKIEDVDIEGNINVANENGIRAGLICGEAYNSVISRCVTKGVINASTNSGVWVGGITGYLSTESDSEEKSCGIYKCQNNADITVNGTCNYKVYGLNYFVGGIVGLSGGAISECSNYGNISATGKSGSSEYFYTISGGICGNSDGEINNCYNAGDVSATGAVYAFAGGIIGHWYQFSDISNCHNIGEVKAEVKDAVDEFTFAGAGGIIGEAELIFEPCSEEAAISDYAAVKNCYYLDIIDKAYGDVVPAISINVKALSADEFAVQSSFEGFDFNSIWAMDENKGYPVFKWECEEEESSEPSTDEPTTATTEPVTEPTTSEVVTTAKPTEPVTNPVTVPSTVTTQPITEIKPTVPSTTQPITETEPSTEPSTEPDDIGVLAWLMNVIKTIVDFIVRIFVMLGC